MSSSVIQAKSSGFEGEGGEGVGAVGVEAGGNDEEIGGEGLQGRQALSLPGGAEGVATLAGGQRKVDHVVGHTGFMGGAGAGVAGGLVAGDVEEIGIGLEDMLGAVAVVDVEIDDRDALELPVMAGRAGRQWRRC